MKRIMRTTDSFPSVDIMLAQCLTTEQFHVYSVTMYNLESKDCRATDSPIQTMSGTTGLQPLKKSNLSTRKGTNTP